MNGLKKQNYIILNICLFWKNIIRWNALLCCCGVSFAERVARFPPKLNLWDGGTVKTELTGVTGHYTLTGVKARIYGGACCEWIERFARPDTWVYLTRSNTIIIVLLYYASRCTRIQHNINLRESLSTVTVYGLWRRNTHLLLILYSKQRQKHYL